MDLARAARRGIPAIVLASVVGVGTGAGAGTSGAQQEMTNPLAGKPGAVEEGRMLFRSECGLCHGIGARGGNRGPDLTAGRWIHGGSDAAVFRTVTRGVPGTEMPPSTLSDDEVWMIVAYLRSLSVKAADPLPGDLDEGERIFFGQGTCSQCHMVNGRGGRLGPDLSRIGARRSPASLVENIRAPGKEVLQGYESVAVFTKDGSRITGVRRNEDTFSIQLMDQNETIHRFLKSDLREVRRVASSMMPEFREAVLSAPQLQHLIAYLDSLRGRPQASAGRQP